MAKNETRRLSPAQIQDDKDAFSNLGQIAGYVPADGVTTVVAGAAVETDMGTKQDKEAFMQKEADKARDIANAAEWKFHNFMLAAKKQVSAQFGDNSNELQSLGLKK